MINQVLNGDCLDLMQNIPTGSIDMILCDLPYGTTACKWDVIIPFDLLWKEYKRIIKNNGAIVLTAAEPFASYLRISNISEYKYDWVWNKIKGTGYLNSKKQPLRSHEVVCVFYRGQCIYNPQKTFGHKLKTATKTINTQSEVYGKFSKDNFYSSTERYPKTIQTFSNDTQKSSLHPTQKPVALFEYLIKTYTNEGDTVLDNCAGSGTTAIACLNTKRNYILMEKEEKYFNIINERIRKHYKDLTTQINMF